MRRRLLLLTLLVAVSVQSADGATSCRTSCDDDVAACVAATCGALSAPIDCVERCRGQVGCPVRIGTLAYVVTHCRAHDGRLVGSQELRIRRGDCDPITVLHLDTGGEVDDQNGACALLGHTREGFGSSLAGAFKRLGVSPDGSGVVFEVSAEVLLIGGPPLTEAQQGFFYVGSDGTGLRRLGPPSRDWVYRVGLTSTGKPTANFRTHLDFSPSGHRIAYTDRVAPDDPASAQIFTMDVRTGLRVQVTHLPRVPVKVLERAVGDVFFVDEHTIQFDTHAFGANQPPYVIHTDGTGLRQAYRLPTLGQAVSSNPVSASIGVTRRSGRIFTFPVDGVAENSDPSNPGAPIWEAFRVAGRNVLQLTSFGRYDTFAIGVDQALITTPMHRPRALIMASADPLGENPLRNCQLFTVGPFGGSIRQLTHVDAGVPSALGCNFQEGDGCAFSDIYQDPLRDSILFYSNCDPLGVNRGSEMFAMRRDGSELRQVTHTDGVRFGPGDDVEVEMPGPVAYPTRRR